MSEAHESAFVTASLHAWTGWTTRLSKLFDSLSDQELMTPIAPGKNRPVYLLGHLTAVHDAMVPQLRLGEATYPELRETFIAQPDSAYAGDPSIETVRQNWKDVSTRLDALLAELTPAQWLERHSSVSEEDFVKEPHRNRFAILVSRTGHAAYHCGQLILRAKP